MNRIKILFTTALLLMLCVTVQAQFGKALGKAVENAAKSATVRKAEQKTDEAVSKTIDKVTDTNTYKDDGNDNANNNQQQTSAAGNAGNAGAAPAQSPQQGAASAEMAYAKSDFVPGDEIIFDDDVSREKLGEFPSQWDLKQGNVEVASVNGEKAILFVAGQCEITPLMKTPKNYLPESFTIELDFYVPAKTGGYWEFHLHTPNKRVAYLSWWAEAAKDKGIQAFWQTPSEEGLSARSSADLSRVGWHRLAMSFNKRAWKVYIDGLRVINVPNMMQPSWFYVYGSNPNDGGYYFRNIRIAKGAVPLYDRLMNEGKFITYGITFDVGKSNIKPESMGEINRIVTLMKENPNLKFSVEGHTDSTGGAASNQTLSEARSQAVVDKLISMGIAADRLKAAGKGQTAPIADNSTDEGRAKNRRVEFVKL